MGFALDAGVRCGDTIGSIHLARCVVKILILCLSDSSDYCKYLGMDRARDYGDLFWEGEGGSIKR
jgi:hypothetical protein